MTYRIDVSNPSAAGATNVIVTDQLPPGLTFLNSNPAANSSPSGNEWQIGELGSQQTRSIEANYRVGATGNLEFSQARPPLAILLPRIASHWQLRLRRWKRRSLGRTQPLLARQPHLKSGSPITGRSRQPGW